MFQGPVFPVKVTLNLPILALFIQIESVPLMVATKLGKTKIRYFAVSPIQPVGPISTTLKVSVPEILP